jgi:hypothetical protein
MCTNMYKVVLLIRMLLFWQIRFRIFWPKKRVQTCTRLFCCFTFFSFFEWQDSPLFGARLTEKSKTHNCKLIWNAFSDLILHFLRSYPLFNWSSSPILMLIRFLKQHSLDFRSLIVCQLFSRHYPSLES